jgi:MFS family permease
LFSLPGVGRLLLGMQLARIAHSMVSLTMVLFTLSEYRSEALAGLTTFFSVFPGLLISPIGGALLDRHGRTRLVTLDYVVALIALTLIGALALLDTLPVWLLIVIAAIASLTAPLSATGLRSLFPIIVPRELWERANAVDSTGYVIASVIGPPLAATIVSFWGGPVAFIVIGITFGLAALVIARFPEPSMETASTGRLTVDAWQGLIYTWRNPTLRALGFSISALNMVGGVLMVVIPLIVERLQLDKTFVGLTFAAQGLTGTISAFLFGRVDTRNRERRMLVVPMLGTAIAVAVLLFDANLVTLIVVMSITGVLNGPLDIALFTLRQRRTDSSWTGRAFAVSMAFNYTGIPIGAALAGLIVAASSIEAAILFGVVMCVASGVLASSLIPSAEPAKERRAYSDR